MEVEATACTKCDGTAWEDCTKCNGEGCVPGGDSMGLLKRGGCDGGRMTCRTCRGTGFGLRQGAPGGS